MFGSSVVRVLADGGYDIIWVRTGAPGILDLDVLRYACQEKPILLTFEKDFGELAVKDNLYHPPGIILVRLPMKNPDLIAKYILVILKSRTGWEGHFSVVEEKKVRIRPLPP